MMSLNNKNFHMAAFGVSRFLALAILIFLGAGGAFPLFADWSNSDASRLASIQGDINTLVLHLASQSPSMEEDLSVLRTAVSNTGIGFTSDGSGLYPVSLLGLLRGWVDSGNVSAPSYLSQYNRGLLYYSGASHDTLTNLDYKVSTISDKLSYDSGDGEETVAEIVADIRDRMTNQNDFALGIAFTNLAYMFSLQTQTSMTNFNAFADALSSASGMPLKYTVNALYYNQIYGGLPLSSQFGPASVYPHYPGVLNRWYSNQRNFLNSLGVYPNSSNLLEYASNRRYLSYNTYQQYNLWTNFLTKANFVTYTNYNQSTPQFALDWFDSYNTKFQNMLLQYGTLAAITNSEIRQVDFARNWYDSYSPRVILDYLIMSDYLSGTNDLATMAEGVSSTINDYAMEKLPKWGMNTNSASLDMGVIPSTENAGYKSQGDAIQAESELSAGYLNKGWTVFDTVQESYDTVIETIISKIHDGSDGGVEGAKSGGHQGLSLRIAALESEYVNIPEQYIDFNLPSDAKDKLKDFWALIKKCLEWGMWTWAFFACWGMLCDREFKQASPTILD